MLRNIKDMSYYQASNLLGMCEITNREVRNVLLNRIKQLSSIGCSFEQYENDMNTIVALVISEYNVGNYEKCLEILSAAYKEFKYVDLLFYMGIVYFKMNNRNESIESFRRYIMFGGYLNLDQVFEYLALCYDHNEYEQKRFVQLSKKYQLLYHHDRIGKGISLL